MKINERLDIVEKVVKQLQEIELYKQEDKPSSNDVEKYEQYLGYDGCGTYLIHDGKQSSIWVNGEASIIFDSEGKEELRDYTDDFKAVTVDSSKLKPGEIIYAWDTEDRICLSGFGVILGKDKDGDVIYQYLSEMDGLTRISDNDLMYKGEVIVFKGVDE